MRGGAFSIRPPKGSFLDTFALYTMDTFELTGIDEPVFWNGLLLLTEQNKKAKSWKIASIKVGS